MLRLKCPTQNYAWGRLGRSSSEVAKLVEGAGFEVDDSKPYAELWMGTHPSGHAALASKEHLTLAAWLEDHPEALGQQVLDHFGSGLPFLLKVLSCEKALSIQSHPDKKLAQKLHAERPEVYKDDNHKPEMVVALSPFTALCGFVPQAELAEAFRSVPELGACVGHDLTAAITSSAPTASQPAAENGHVPLQNGNSHSSNGNHANEQASSPSEVLKAAFTALMTCDSSKVAEQVEKLAERLRQDSKQRALSVREALAMRLQFQYRGDVGVLASFFLNLIDLTPGQAMYLAANVPHAYIAGEAVECMATSDNVVRAGLTPKLRDTQVLCDSLTYEQGPPVILNGEGDAEHTAIYRPPFEEFEVALTTLSAGHSCSLSASQGPQMCLVQHGSAQMVAEPRLMDSHLETAVAGSKGDVFFIPAGCRLLLTGGEEGARVWIASVCQVFWDQHKIN